MTMTAERKVALVKEFATKAGDTGSPEVQGASLTEERRLILSMLTSIRLADVERFATDETRVEQARGASPRR